MRMEIITNKGIISMGILAKDIFAKTVLEIDENNSFDVVNEVKKDTIDKVKQLPIECGITDEVKSGIIEIFEKLSIGSKFLCVNDWLTSRESPRVQAYKKILKNVNNGMTYKNAAIEANIWLREQSKK